MVSRWAFLGMNVGTSRIETCLAPDGSLEKVRLWSALDRVTNSNPLAPVARATRKAVLYDSNSREMFLSDPSTVKGGFIRPLRTTPRCHLGRISWDLGRCIAHSTEWIMNGVLLEGSGQIDDFQDACYGRSMKLDGVNLFVLIEQMYQIFRQRNVREIFGRNSSGIGLRYQWFPLRIVNIAWRISQWIGCHVHYGSYVVMGQAWVSVVLRPTMVGNDEVE